jgi:hypothetical protein
MNIMKKYFILSFLVTALLLTQKVVTYGQTSVMKTPAKYIMPMDNASAALPGVKNKNGEFWLVFSDRSNNPVYSDKTCKTTSGKNLKFMHPLYVIEESPDAVRVVEISDADARGNLKDGALGRSGWVLKNNMLLWSSCLKTRDVKLPEFKDGIFNKKAMVLNIISDGQQEIRVPEYYSNPRCSSSDSINSALVYQINYVYKETADAYLLGDIPRIANVDKDLGQIRGWVRKSQTSAWNHRLAYEINWDATAVTERKSKGARAKIAADKAMATAPIYQEPSSYYSSRAIGELDRFPVLEVLNGVSKVGMIGELRAEGGKTISSMEFAEIKHVIDSMSVSLRNVNVIFVIDATNSMLAYSKPIQDAIKQSMRDLLKSKNNFKFGAVLYRDASEGNSNAVHYTRDISSNYTGVTNLLSKYMLGTSNKCNNDNEDCVYYGIKKAIERFDPPVGESNYVVLIGNTASHKRTTYTDCAGKTNPDFTAVDEKELTDLLARKNINLISYQVQHQVVTDTRAAYDDFRSQVKNLMRQITVKRLVNQQINEEEILTADKNTTEINPIYGITGRFMPAPDGGTIAPTVFQKELESGLSYIDSRVNKQLDAVSMYLNGKLKGDDLLQLNGFINQLKQQKIAEEKLDVVFQKNGQIYTTGYTKRFESGLKNPIYQDVLLMSHEDLFAIKKSLERLVPTDDLSLSANDSRSFIFYAWGDILVNILGYFPEGDQSIDTLSLYTLSAILTGWGGKEKFKDIKLMDVVDEQLFPSVLLYEYLMDWCITKGHIQSIFDGQNVLTGNYFEDHQWTIFNEYLFNLTGGKVESDPALKDLFVSYFKKYQREYNNYKAVFRIPIGTGSGVKHFWIDSRIFPHNTKEFGEKDLVEVLYAKYLK